jgi:hypothetical protein
MIENPIYAGTLYWNRSKWVKVEDSGESDTGKAQKKAKCIRNEQGTHEGRFTRQCRQRAAPSLRQGSNVEARAAAAEREQGPTGRQAPTVRRDVAEQVILKPIIDELLAPDVIAEMVTEMRAYYKQRTADAKAEKAKVPAEVAELDQRIARLRARLKAGDADMAADDIMAVIEKVEAQKQTLLSAQPEAKHREKLLRALPAAAKQYRDDNQRVRRQRYRGWPCQGGSTDTFRGADNPKTRQGQDAPGSPYGIPPCSPARG